jgi:hypothetical protein
MWDKMRCEHVSCVMGVGMSLPLPCMNCVVGKGCHWVGGVNNGADYEAGWVCGVGMSLV